MIHPKHILSHPTRPTLVTPDSFQPKSSTEIPVVDKSAPAAIIDLTFGQLPVPSFDTGEQIHDIKKGEL